MADFVLCDVCCKRPITAGLEIKYMQKEERKITLHAAHYGSIICSTRNHVELQRENKLLHMAGYW